MPHASLRTTEMLEPNGQVDDVNAFDNIYHRTSKDYQEKQVEIMMKRFEAPNRRDLSKKLKDVKFRSNQKNNFNFSYVGPLYMGSEAEEVWVVYDTGSDELILKDEVFKQSDSTTYA